MSEPIVFLPLTQGKVATIDFSDFEKVGRFKWYAMKTPSGNFYAVRTETIRGTKKHKTFLLHGAIMDAKGIDHINGNGLDCRRENMRRATDQQNHKAFRRKRLGTSSIYRGVSWYARDLNWEAKVGAGYKTFHLGRFINEEDAARAYDKKVTELGFFKEALNFP